MIPTPPTSSEIEATVASRTAMVWLLLAWVSAIWLRFRTEKSFGRSGWMW